MPSLVRVLLHPETRRPDPAPFELDVLRVIAIGTSTWAVAFIVSGLLYLTGTASWQVPTTCAIGVVVGAAWWWHEHRRARRRGGQRPNAAS